MWRETTRDPKPFFVEPADTPPAPGGREAKPAPEVSPPASGGVRTSPIPEDPRRSHLLGFPGRGPFDVE
jgi:hypothetical protein